MQRLHSSDSIKVMAVATIGKWIAFDTCSADG